MDDVEVDVVDAEPLEAPFRLGRRIGATAGIELRRHEELVTRDAALAQPLPDAFFVAVRLRRVDVPVAELERPPNGVHALGSVGNLPDPEADQRDLVPVGEHAPLSVGRHRRHRIAH